MMPILDIHLSLFRKTPLRLAHKKTKVSFTSNGKDIHKEFDSLVHFDKWVYSEEAKNILKDPNWTWSGEVVLRDPPTNQYLHFQGARNAKWKRVS